MKKFISILMVMALILAMAPACFAAGHVCHYSFHEYNGDGTHTAYCCYSLWHNFVEPCYSDNNENGKCDFCGAAMAHEHEWEEEWSFNTEAHWYACTDETDETPAEELKDYAEHSFGEDGLCTVCGFPSEAALEAAEEVTEETVEEVTEETAQ